MRFTPAELAALDLYVARLDAAARPRGAARVTRSGIIRAAVRAYLAARADRIPPPLDSVESAPTRGRAA